MDKFSAIICNSIMIILTYSTIFTAISMLFSEVTLATSVSLLIAFTMFVSSFNLVNKVSMARYYYSASWDRDKLIEFSIIGENPFFPGEGKRHLYQTILYLMPTGNALMMSNKISHANNATDAIEHRSDYNNTIILLTSISETLILTGLGMSIFNKKQLK